jgi:hypothetical protein
VRGGATAELHLLSAAKKASSDSKTTLELAGSVSKVRLPTEEPIFPLTIASFRSGSCSFLPRPSKRMVERLVPLAGRSSTSSPEFCGSSSSRKSLPLVVRRPRSATGVPSISPRRGSRVAAPFLKVIWAPRLFTDGQGAGGCRSALISCASPAIWGAASVLEKAIPPLRIPARKPKRHSLGKVSRKAPDNPD